MLFGRLVGSKSFPSLLPVTRSARLRLPSDGSLGPHFPTFLGTMLSYDRPVSFSGRFAAARFPIPCALPHLCVPLWLVSGGKLTRNARALGHPVPLVFRECSQGGTGLSQVPELPLWCHAPLSPDPGGVLPTCHTMGGLLPSARATASALAAQFALSSYPSGPPLSSFRGSLTRPGTLLPPAPYASYEGCTRRSLLSCWLGVAQVGLEFSHSHPLGNNDLFPEVLLQFLDLGLRLARGASS